MLKKLVVAAVVLGCFSLSSVAQDVEGVNARLDAMGGSGVPSDFGFVIDRPLKCVAWADRVQATGVMREITGIEDYFGAVIATKSIIKDRFAIGLTFNDRREMPGDFYDKYYLAPYNADLINFGTVEDMFEKFANYPRLLLGFKISDNFQFGLGSFIEHSTYDHLQESEQKYAVVGSNDSLSIMVDSVIDYKYVGIGGIFDFKVKVGKLGINPEFKVFIPKFEGTMTSNAKDKINNNPNLADTNTFTNTDWDLKSTEISKNIQVKAGAKLSGNINDIFVIGGLWYQTGRFNYERTRKTSSIILGPGISNTFDTSYIEDGGERVFKQDQILFWGGFERTIFEDLYFTTDYVGKFIKTAVTHAAGQDTTFKMHGDTIITVKEHKFRMGVERECNGFWIIERFVPRMGLVYKHARVSKDIENVVINGNALNMYQNSAVKTNFTEGTGDQDKGMKLTMGIGLEGKYATLDLSLNVLEWKQGLIMGPDAAIVSLTVFASGRKP